MKTKLLKYFFLLTFLFLLIACSTKKDRLINRQFQALNTKYNVLYNGNVALDKGIIDVKSQYKDNFWEILPIERMQVSNENILPGQSKNANFDLAEVKATKAIQKRSMNIDGREKNPQIDEAHLLLGKSRYYDQRFIPALEAFNYILYKYPESDKIYEAKIWREKTNMRLENDAIALKNLKRLLKEIKFKDQIFADANATLSQAFLNLGEKDSAVVRLKEATKFTKSNEEKARYRFILGQLYEDLGYKDSAFVAYQSVVDMNRKSSRRYIIQAYAKQAQQFDYEKGDTLAFIKTYKDLLKDRENRPFLDVINYQMALFYDKKNNDKQAKYYYNKSLRTKSEDQYLMASDYRNLAKRNFDNAKYQTAGQYYDSTLVRLTPRTREFNSIKKKRENLEDVIKYEGIAQRNDSILNVMSLSDADKKGFYEDYIVKIKKADEAKLALEKIKIENEARASDNTNNDNDPLPGKINNVVGDNRSKDGTISSNAPSIAPPTFGPKPTSGSANAFYFYNPSTVAFGKIEFKKKWGNRKQKNNWRLSSDQLKGANSGDEDSTLQNNETEKATDENLIEPKYTADFYLKQLPTTQKEIDSLAKNRNFAYFQLGVIYKEKFKEYNLAANKLEQLLDGNPEERLVLPAMYNLFKIYEIINKDKALAMKTKIINQFPNSRYAQILSNANYNETLVNQSPEAVYENLYSLYEDGKLFKVLNQTTKSIDQFTGEEIVPKFELLKANTIGKLKGLAEYKTALNFVALNYPNVEEGKSAEEIISKNIPLLEKMNFYDIKPESWKIIYKVNNSDSLKTKPLVDKIKKFTSERTSEKLRYSEDIYTMTEGFVVIHGIPSEQKAIDIVSILKDYKDYKILETAIVISNENYKIVQIKKNLQDYLITPKTDPIGIVPYVPKQSTPSIEKPVEKNNEKVQNEILKLKNPTPPQPSGKNLNIQDSDDPVPANQSSAPTKIDKLPQAPPKRP